MRATISFNTLIEDILSDTATMLNKRAQSYGDAGSTAPVQAIATRIEHASLQQLPDILAAIAQLRTDLAGLDYALDDTMKILTGYVTAMTEQPEETQTSNEV